MSKWILSIRWRRKNQRVNFYLIKKTEYLFLLNSYGFFEFQNEQMALEAVKQTDGYRLDKNHTFSVTLMSDFDRYKKNI